jgi:hypothetical protein
MYNLTFLILKKNAIQQQADDFMLYVIKGCTDHRNFIRHCTKAMINYKKSIHCIVFLERLHELLKANEERHLQFCRAADDECRFSKFYKVVVFYLKNEIDFKEKDLPFTYFKKNERRMLDQNIEAMVNLPVLKICNRSNFIKLKLELSEMKCYYFLDKKNWKQLFLGKVQVLENAHVITREQSHSLLESIEERFLPPV